MGKDSESDGVLSDVGGKTIEKDDEPYVLPKKDEKKHKCTYSDCNAVFTRPFRLARHMLAHNGERPHKCTHTGCEKAYTNPWHLKRHSETHTVTKKTYQCSKCSLSISNRHNLKRHYERVHSDQGKLSCTECNASFTKKYQLAEHQATHSSSVYKCGKCNMSFTERRKFRRHEKSHEATKSYPCTVAGCSEVFSKWLLLCKHLKTEHVIEYKCSDCDKVFLSKRHLKLHSQIHSENRTAIPCPFEKCYRMYFYKSNLEHHIRSNHMGEKFECDICKIMISTKAKLSLHIQKIHLSKGKIKSTKKSNRKKRKDAGIPKKSMVTALCGLDLPMNIEKQLLQRETGVSYEAESNV